MAKQSTKTLVFADADNGGIIHVANIKGGVGKSTVATNLAAGLCRRGPTLVIDLDVQGSATHALGKDPGDYTQSSWELFRTRFAPPPANSEHSLFSPSSVFRKVEQFVLPQIVGKGEVTSVTVRIKPSLDLVPAGTGLFKQVSFFALQNFIYNLQLFRGYYKYVVLDTPSVWNTLTRSLFSFSDLNLIPVTLNALSTKSLRHYLLNVRKLAQEDPRVRIRIVKNEVYGKQTSKVVGKIRTMNENRRFLESLCEQVAIHSETGVTVLPQSVMFDLEIPESASVRDAQDAGMPVHELHRQSAAGKAFEELSRRVQYVLNNPVVQGTTGTQHARHNGKIIHSTAKVLAAAGLAAMFFTNTPVQHPTTRRPIAPQELIASEENVLELKFDSGQSLYRVAKHGISHFRAMVPSFADVSAYAAEIVDIHNKTRAEEAQKLSVIKPIPEGTTIRIFPPSAVRNRHQERLVPVYRYFCTIVDDNFAYITGDWCERGTGGGTPHYGIDVAANLGTKILAPIDGTVVLQTSSTAGRSLGIVDDKTLVFFSHMGRRFFKTGDLIKKGQAVGTVGMTGRTSGPHVHIGYGVRILDRGGIRFGDHRYRLTDPKLFFYREHFIKGVGE